MKLVATGLGPAREVAPSLDADNWIGLPLSTGLGGSGVSAPDSVDAS